MISSKKHVKKDNQMMKLPNTIVTSIVLFLIMMIVFFTVNSFKPSDVMLLQQYMHSEVLYKDGHTETLEDGNFGTINKLDKVIVTIDIPQDKSVVNPELYIPLYNAIVNVYLDGQEIYHDKADMDNISKHYGNRIYEIPLPREYKDMSLVLEITSVVSMPFSDLQGIAILPANEAWKQIIANEGLVFTLSLALMVLAIICVFYFIVRSISLRHIQLGLPIALFELLINAWFFGSLRMFYLIIGNVELCAKLEYYALFLAPLPLAAFIHTVIDVPFFKKLMEGTLITYLVYYVTATIIELSPADRNYSDMLTSMHLLTALTIVIMVVSLFVGTKHKTNQYIFILRWGVLISMLCGIVELARFNITKYLLETSWVSTHGVSAVAILVIAAALVIYLISVSADKYTSEIEKKQLILLAYKDALTDMPNRASCYRSIEDMEKNEIKNYTMVFIDLNNLKVANDEYGHETGDRLLKVTAGHIQDVFTEHGFCARWGGDEFVACVYGEYAKAEELIESFRHKLAEEDASGAFPFKVSAACGLMTSNDDNYMEPLEAIRHADAIMYENKKKMKAARA